MRNALRWFGLLGMLTTALACARAPEPASAPMVGVAHEVHELSTATGKLWDKPVTDEVIYFLMVDRFANGAPQNDRGVYAATDADPTQDAEILKHGFAPTLPGYFHGGDLVGLREKLPYLRGLGVTSIWVSPVYGNKPVQGSLRDVATSGACYHGYCPLDFLNVDPHFGTNQEFKTLVTAAHRAGIKVILDVVANHTADVIQHAECLGDHGSCGYRDKAGAPYKDRNGQPFDDVLLASQGLFPELDLSSFPYRPVISAADATAKNPAWLNDPVHYHNRGVSTFEGESGLYGDFYVLDDLFSTHPQVVAGMTEIFRSWIRDFGVDGFRLDAARHVHASFWKKWVPALKSFAAQQGKPNFYVFGEVYDGNPVVLGRELQDGAYDAPLDFAFQWSSVGVFSEGRPTSILRDVFLRDDAYAIGERDSRTLPTFLSNHDMGRLGARLRRDNPEATDEELVTRAKLSHALMFTSRGIPVLYYGDEQGFTGLEQRGQSIEIGDYLGRQDMFEGLVPDYADPAKNAQLGTTKTPADDNFDRKHPLYRAISRYAALRAEHRALRDGVQFQRYASDLAGGDLYAFSRISPSEQREYLVVFNARNEARRATFETASARTTFAPVFSSEGPTACDALASDAGASVSVALPALSFAVYRAAKTLPARSFSPPDIRIVSPQQQFGSGYVSVEAELAQRGMHQVSFFVREPGQPERLLGRDHEAPYRVEYDSRTIVDGATVEFRAEVKGSGRQAKSAKRTLVIESRPVQVALHYENGNQRSSVFAITDSGRFLFPQALDADGATFESRAGERHLTLFFESALGDSFAFDQPLVVELAPHVYPYTEPSADGTYRAGTVYINNRYEFAGAPHDVSSPLPATLPNDAAAANPLTVPLFVRGSMNGWSTANALAYVGNYGLSGSVAMSSDVSFKFADATWSTYNYGGPFGTHGLTHSQSSANIVLSTAAGPPASYRVHFFSFPPANGTQDRLVFYRVAPDDGPVVDHGPYGPIYLRGAPGISPLGGWETTEANLFRYDGATDTLSLDVVTASTSQSASDFQFKIANGSWSVQLTGASPTWLAPENQLIADVPYVVGRQGETLWVTPAPGTYRFRIDVSDPNAPVLNLSFAP